MTAVLKICLTVSLLWGCFSGFCQKNETYHELEQAAYRNEDLMRSMGDSLIAIDQKKHQAKVFLEYANHFYYLDQFEPADSMYKLTIQYAQEHGDKLNENKARVRRAILLRDLNRLDESYTQLSYLEKRFKEEGDYYNRIDAINSMGHIKFDQYQPDSGLFYYRKALDLAIENNSSFQRAYILNNIGLFELDEGMMDEALQDFKEAYKYAVESREIRLESTLATNIGLMFMRLDSLSEAVKHFNMLLVSAKEANAPVPLGTAYINLGTVHIEKADYRAAQLYYDSALTQMRISDDSLLICKMYNAIGNLQTKKGQYQQTLMYADSALGVASRFGVLRDEMLAHLLMSNAWDSLRSSDSALYHYRMYKSLSDSLRDLGKEEVIAEMQAKYELKDKETELIRAKAENEVLKKDQEINAIQRRNYLFGFIFLIIVLLALGYIIYQRIIRKQKEQFAQTLIKNIEEERGRIARDLHDDVGQTLSMLKNRIESQKNQDQDEILTESLSSVINQTREISRNLYPNYLRKVSIEVALETLFSKIEDTTEMTCSLESEQIDRMISEDQKMHLYRIVQELTNNTLKHSQGNALKLMISTSKNDIKFTYLDNGSGFKSKQDLSGIGLMSIKERVSLMNGSVTMTSNKPTGIKVQIKFNGKPV